MKIFVVIAEIELTHKPTWLDDFRRRYDEDFPYHVTLKLPCYIEDDQVSDIKTKLSTLFSNIQIANHAIPLVFDKLALSMDAPAGGCIMINATNGEQIRELQKNVITTLSEYNRYYEAKYQEYEQQFQPHITIARDLSEQGYAEATKALGKDYACEGNVNKIKLIVVNNYGPVEASDPANQTVYNL